VTIGAVQVVLLVGRQPQSRGVSGGIALIGADCLRASHDMP
jgi:hypothetical protein